MFYLINYSFDFIWKEFTRINNGYSFFVLTYQIPNWASLNIENLFEKLDLLF